MLGELDKVTPAFKNAEQTAILSSEGCVPFGAGLGFKNTPLRERFSAFRFRASRHRAIFSLKIVPAKNPVPLPKK
jgi:hypothetical protein